MDQFYLFEIIVNEIVFDENLPEKEIPQENDQLRVEVIFAHLINAEVKIHDLRGFLLEKDQTGRHLYPKLGKSILFTIQPTKLLAILSKYPLELCLKRAVAPYVMGRVNVPWDYAFYDIITHEGSDNEEDYTVIPAVTNEIYQVINENSTKISDLYITLKLTPFGQNVHAQVQVIPRGFVLEGLSPKKYFFKVINTETVFKVQLYQTKLADNPCLPKKPQIKEKTKVKNLTKEELNKILCKHDNCYSTQEFARLGLGPRAVRPKTEGMREIVVHHGMCHIFGSLDNYGPNSNYLRPKTLNSRFIGKNSERFSSPKYIKKVTDYVMRDRGPPDKHVCTCQYESGDRARPHPIYICWDLLQSYDALVNNYRCVMGLPPFPPAHLPICLNLECPMRNFYDMSLDDPRCCKVFLKHFLDRDHFSTCDDPDCPFNVKPPCQMFYVAQPQRSDTSSNCMSPDDSESKKNSSSTTNR